MFALRIVAHVVLIVTAEGQCQLRNPYTRVCGKVKTNLRYILNPVENEL